VWATNESCVCVCVFGSIAGVLSRVFHVLFWIIILISVLVLLQVDVAVFLPIATFALSFSFGATRFRQTRFACLLPLIAEFAA
jgi:hypothetical protein